MLKRGSKGQAWSLDLIIAIVIFVLVITIFYTLLIREPEVDVGSLKAEAKNIEFLIDTETVQGGDCSFLTDAAIDRSQIETCFETLSSDPVVREAFKKEHNIKSNFCIFVIDQNGNVISIPSTTVAGEFRTGAGYDDLTISDERCGELFDPTP